MYNKRSIAVGPVPVPSLLRVMRALRQQLCRRRGDVHAGRRDLALALQRAAGRQDARWRCDAIDPIGYSVSYPMQRTTRAVVEEGDESQTPKYTPHFGKHLTYMYLLPEPELGYLKHPIEPHPQPPEQFHIPKAPVKIRKSRISMLKTGMQKLSAWCLCRLSSLCGPPLQPRRSRTRVGRAPRARTWTTRSRSRWRTTRAGTHPTANGCRRSKGAHLHI